MKDRSLIHKINLTFIAPTAATFHYFLSDWKTVECGLPPEFGPGGGAQRKYDTININYVIDNAYTDVFRHLVPDVHFFTPEVQANQLGSIRSMIRQRIYPTGTHPATMQPHDDPGSLEQDFVNYLMKQLIV